MRFPKFFRIGVNDFRAWCIGNALLSMPLKIYNPFFYVKNLSNTILSIHRSYADDIINQEEQKKVANAILSYCDEHAPTKHCPICGKKMVRKQGKESDFWGCSGYRDGCRYIESVN